MSDVVKVVVAMLTLVGLLVSALLGACAWYLRELREEYRMTRAEIVGLRSDVDAASDALDRYLERELQKKLAAGGS